MGFAIGWGVAALIAAQFLLVAKWAMTPASEAPGYALERMILLPSGLSLGVIGALVAALFRPSTRKVAIRLEKQYPELDGRLTTALQQTPDEGGGFTFLQEHLFAETIHHSTQQDWQRVVPDTSLRWAQVAQYAALAAFLGLWFMLPQPPSAASGGSAAAQDSGAPGVEVTPGDTDLEKGSSLVLLARFTGTVPAAAEIVIGESSESERRIPLTRSLSDPVFGESLPEVKEPFSYRVSWDGGTTRDYKVRVFEYPKLERADVTLTYPDYTKLPPKRIEDTRHTSAVEGTRIDLELALNKPVASAVLEPRKAKGQEQAPAPLKLETSPDKASAVLRGYVPAQSVRYDLVLTDADGRRNKQSVPFSFDVVPNRVPEMKLASPKGDQKPSALQELNFDGTVWDDFGVVACGLELGTPGGETVTLEFGKDVPAKEKRAFQQLLRLEELNAVPDQLFAWHTWADDIGPDGKVRRTKGDLFFAEIRPFEEIFRQGEATDSEQQQQQAQQEQQQGMGNLATKLAQLQKQIINATWKLQRAQASPKQAEDLKVVRDSQEDAHTQAEEASAKAAERPQIAAHWQTVLQHMQQAIEGLDKAAAAPPELATALGSEQAAYQALLKLQAREKQVSRANRQQQQGQQGQSQGEQQQQQQLDQLDLTQKENRYETQREAQAQQSAERREQMQVLNRLKELAERQGDVNEKLKELQTALNEAKTEEEKEEARRKLKRLEEEQRQMLADADELKQRMEQQQNQSQTSEQRELLEQARENMQQAAEAAAEGQASQALASGTRAQEQMQQMREELRKQSAGAFEEELRQMRAEARELARNQEEIAKEMKNDPSDPTDPQVSPGKAPTLGGGPDEEKLTEQLQQQEQRTGDLVQRATELSEQAEPSEPLLSRQIYEAARQFAQDDTAAVKEVQQEMVRERRFEMFDELRELQERERAGKALRLTAELQRQNQDKQAARTGERASEGLSRLRQGIEQATESVLGDDTAALRLAESQLEAAAEAMQREMEQQQGGQPPQPGKEQTTAGTQREGEPREEQQPGKGESRQPGNGEPRENQEQVAQNQTPGGQPPKQGQANGRQPGQRQGSGQPREGQQPNEQQPREGDGQVAQNQPQEGQPSQQQGEGRQPGERQSQPGNQPGQQGDGERAAQERGQRQPGEANDNRGGGGGSRAAATNPLTGDGFTNWSDSLREAEEMIDQNDLRNGIAQARERARQMRLDMKREGKKADWPVVQLEILKPLVEVRSRLREELARRDSDKALVPVDRDPVPAQFSENVRRYYEQLGKE